MKILIIGSPQSIFIKNYIKYVLDTNCNEVFLTSSSSLPNELKEFYQFRGVKLVNLYEKPTLFKAIPGISNVIAFKRNLRNLSKDKFDVIHMHYIGSGRIMKHISKDIRNASKKLVLTFWGSDILAINDSMAGNIKKLVDVADIITCSTLSMMEKVKEVFGCSAFKKINQCFFGNELFDYINSNKNDFYMNNDTNLLSIPKGKIAVAIGYNGSPRQQHDKVILALNDLPQETKKKLYIVIQASYGNNDEEYIEYLKKLMVESDLEFVIVDKYLSTEETISFKKKINIFIHAQISDALSSSVLEYILMGTEIISPRWIPYHEWKTLGIEFNQFSSFDEINELLKGIISGDIKTDHKANETAILNNFSWKSCASNWKKIYVE